MICFFKAEIIWEKKTKSKSKKNLKNKTKHQIVFMFTKLLYSCLFLFRSKMVKPLPFLFWATLFLMNTKFHA